MCTRPDCPTGAKHLKCAEDLNKELASRGLPPLDPKKDIMPDGFHAKVAKFRSWPSKTAAKLSIAKRSLLNRKEANALCSKLEGEHQNLSDPRPDPMEWGSFKTRWYQFRKLFLISQTAVKNADQLKAASILLEYTKSKPKQELEVTSKDTDDFSDVRLLTDLAIQMGIKPKEIEKLLGGKTDS